MVVYYLCPVNDQAPFGGVVTLYRHVDMLNSIGRPAKIVHGLRGFRCTWFENDTPIVYPPFEVSDRDLIVVPEVLSPRLGAMAPGVPKVSFNQNAYMTHLETSLTEPHAYQTSADLLGVMCVSEDNRRYLAYAFPGVDVQRVFYSYGDIDFSAPAAPKLKQIAYMPRKRKHDAHAVLSVLRARGALDGWDLVAIDGLERKQVAETLKRSALFLSFSEYEGFGMPPMEALACGCFVIGYTGLGGAEYFDPRFTLAVPESDIYAFARDIEGWLRAWTPSESATRGLAASEYIRDRYSHEIERKSVAAALSHFLAKLPASTGTTQVLRPEDTWTKHGRPLSNRYRAARQMKDSMKTLVLG